MNAVEWEQECEKIIVFRNAVFEGKHSRIEVPEEARLKFLKERLKSSLKGGDKQKEEPQESKKDEDSTVEVKNSEQEVREPSELKRSVSETPLIEELKPVSGEFTNIPGLGSSRVQKPQGSLETPQLGRAALDQEPDHRNTNNEENEILEKSSPISSSLPVLSHVSSQKSTSADAMKPAKPENEKASSQLLSFVSKSLEKIDVSTVKQASSLKSSKSASDIPSPPMSAFAPSRVSAPSPPRVPTFSVPSLKHIQSPANESSFPSVDKLQTALRFPSPPPSAPIHQSPKQIYSSSLKDEVSNVTVKDEELSPPPPPLATMLSSLESPNQQQQQKQPYSPTWVPYNVSQPQTTIRRVPDLPPSELSPFPSDAGSSRPTYDFEFAETKVRFHPYERSMTGMHSPYPSAAEPMSVPSRNSVAPLQFAPYNREGSYLPQHDYPADYSSKEIQNFPSTTRYADFEGFNDQYNYSSSYSPYYHHRMRSSNAFPQMQVPSTPGYYNPSAAVDYRRMTPNPTLHRYPVNDPRYIHYPPNRSYY
ncbi:hypothetical protein SPOG_01749 [Schizosaccharomyces cryophilus OY26]|uniref:Uncharacterized protein n=1 Tax=Schizosaccharomyces cryophilus (strain OY26 / ATCC MYA-4695 / CBS 11777 / NBRC 106824 / NRRL Y48691) TaxID=653667 RepID=S9W246_SCHCR|nr:uncharacterized protein SPOG_01749 [Schizosaccharomyces cryophilus OY26]EPY52424.1 hypothetical protein SPOG_01749 [Schizosaccharomyces cryophilus OY26]